MFDTGLRLGDTTDDYCPRCRLLLDHAIASIVDNKIVKVTCRTCFSEHPYREGKLPLKKKPAARAALFQEVLAKTTPPSEPPAPPVEEEPPSPPKKRPRVTPARYISRHQTSPRGRPR